MTDVPAHTCIAGEWFEAKPIASDLTVVDLRSWWKNKDMAPAYQVSGQLMTVELNGGQLCDAYTEVQAELLETGARGFLEAGGIFGGTRYGRVIVEKQ
jgi:hypothetical protein